MDREPAITNPATASLAVRDADRSIAFYRDVLGFDVKQDADGIEASRGPALIRLGERGSAVVFLQTDDVAGTRSAILARGGSASEIEKVNWIKMSVFEVRDPDGNVLWFGQSYHKDQDSPSRLGSQPHGLRQTLPEMPFDNVPAAVTYYCDVLGFRINYEQDDLGVLERDAITILLIARTAEHKGIGSFGVYVDDADALYAELLTKGAKVLGEPVSRPWGLRDFTVMDLEGNRIKFAQTFE